MKISASILALIAFVAIFMAVLTEARLRGAPIAPPSAPKYFKNDVSKRENEMIHLNHVTYFSIRV